MKWRAHTYAQGERKMKLEEAKEIFEENFLALTSINGRDLKKMSMSQVWKSLRFSFKQDSSPPMAFVRTGGRINFNEPAKKFELIEDFWEVLTTVWKDDHEERIVCLTSNLIELAEIAPKLKLIGQEGSMVKDKR